MSTQTTQSHIDAGRDNIGGNLINNNNNFQFLDAPDSPIPFLMEKLAEEIQKNKNINDFVDTLQMYVENHAPDGVSGLEAKLIHVGRQSEIALAFRKKELFSRLLVKYQMFESAQNILAYILSKMEGNFNAYVLPNISGKSKSDIDQQFHEFLINPCVNEITKGVFLLNSAIVQGMVYWLAEQCYIRWHE